MNKPTVSEKALHLKLKKAKEENPPPQPEKRDNIFSQSNDIREDRDTRQIKSTKKPQTFPLSK